MRHYKNSRQSFVQLGITDNIIAGVCITKGCIETGNIVTGSMLAWTEDTETCNDPYTLLIQCWKLPAKFPNILF